MNNEQNSQPAAQMTDEQIAARIVACESDPTLPKLDDDEIREICESRGWKDGDAPTLRELAHVFWAEACAAQRRALLSQAQVAQPVVKESLIAAAPVAAQPQDKCRLPSLAALPLCDECKSVGYCIGTKERASKLAGQEKPQVGQQLDQIEQYRLQMAAISAAAFGYWKIGDPTKDEYVTVALKDVAKLYEKYDALSKSAQPVQDKQAGQARDYAAEMRDELAVKENAAIEKHFGKAAQAAPSVAVAAREPGDTRLTDERMLAIYKREIYTHGRSLFEFGRAIESAVIAASAQDGGKA